MDDTVSAVSSHPEIDNRTQCREFNLLPLPIKDQLTFSDIAESTDIWEHNPSNPRNLSPLKKWIATAIVSLYTFTPPLASSMVAPGLPDLGLKYNIKNPTVLALTYSVYLLSFGIGPLLLAPLSEMYGRTWVLHISNLFSLIFSIGCALAPTANIFITFRVLGGLSGGAPLAIGGGCISDLFSEEERASAMALYSLVPLIGPAVGPIVGGFVAQTIGVQYVFYVIAGLFGVSSVLGIPLLRETYAPVIRRQLQANGAKLETANTVPQGLDRLDYLWLNLKRPFILLTRSFICFILSLYMAVISGIYYMMFATFPNLFTEVYHFSVGISGFAFTGLGIGFLAASAFGGKLLDRIYHRLAARNGGQGKPEMRIPALIFGSVIAPIGLLWYGWSAQAKVHWIMPIIGTMIYAFSLVLTLRHYSLPIQLYLVDAFRYSASAIAAASVLRYLVSFAFPLFGEQMYTKFDYGVGNTFLAALAIFIGIPFPIWIYCYGERIRVRGSLND